MYQTRKRLSTLTFSTRLHRSTIKVKPLTNDTQCTNMFCRKLPKLSHFFYKIREKAAAATPIKITKVLSCPLNYFELHAVVLCDSHELRMTLSQRISSTVCANDCGLRRNLALESRSKHAPADLSNACWELIPIRDLVP